MTSQNQHRLNTDQHRLNTDSTQTQHRLDIDQHRLNLDQHRPQMVNVCNTYLGTEYTSVFIIQNSDQNAKLKKFWKFFFQLKIF